MKTLRDYCMEVLSECDWNISKAARVLDMPRGTLYGWVKRWGIVTGRERAHRKGGRGVLSLQSDSWSVVRPYHENR